MKIISLLFGGILLAKLAASAAFAASATTAASVTSAPSQSKTAPASFKVIEWDALVPKGWDPLKDYRGKNLGMLDDNSPKVRQMMREIRAIWDNAPTVAAMNGASVKLPGYMVPLEETKAGVKEFLLVPYFGACVHTPPPPANQIIHVFSDKPLKNLRTMDAVWVSGSLSTRRQDSAMGASAYRIDAVQVEKYVAPNRQ